MATDEEKRAVAAAIQGIFGGGTSAPAIQREGLTRPDPVTPVPSLPSPRPSNRGPSANDQRAARADARAAAQERSRKSQNKAQVKSLRETARAIGEQIKAYKKLVGDDGSFARQFRAEVARIDANLGITDRNLLEQHAAQVDNLLNAARDNARAESDMSFSNLTNRARERQELMNQAAMQGAGESDTLKAANIALRNWDANQSDIMRNYYDASTSINASLSDANQATKTARINSVLESNSKRADAFRTQQDQLMDSWSTIGNMYGNQAAQYGNASQYSSDKDSGAYLSTGRDARRQEQANTNMVAAYDSMSAAAGQTYDDPGVDQSLLTWSGQADFKTAQNMNRLESGFSQQQAPKAPEGAKLRSW